MSPLTKIWKNFHYAVGCNLPLNDERLSLVNTIIPNCSSYFTALHYINNLKLYRSYNTTVNLDSNSKKKSIERFQNYLLICLSSVYKTANKSPSIDTNQILLFLAIS